MVPSPMKATRQNHALEHATIALILQRKGVNTKIAGRAALGGFYVYGNLSTSIVEEAAQEALNRLRNGENELALSPFCGTNIAIAGLLAAIASMFALGNRNRFTSLPRVIVASIAAVLAAQPLGKLVQKHLTTYTDLEGMRVTKITKSGLGPWTSHRVDTTSI